MKKSIYGLWALPLMLTACHEESPQVPAQAEWPDDGVYICVDLPGENAGSRLTYQYSDIFYEWGDGNIAARWEIGDYIKVYETKGAAPDGSSEPFTDVYENYDAYNNAHPYPLAPTHDIYYFFQCVAGAGTTHGVFKYIGLCRSTVEAGADGSYNVDRDLIYNHKIRDWDNFDGLAIYGMPLRNYMMRHQTANHNMEHLKYGERMAGNICGHNFLWWHEEYEDPTLPETGIQGFTLSNVSGCVYRIKISNLPRNLYGGGEVTLDIPGVTSGNSLDPDDPTNVLNNPMTLRLGDKRDHQEGKNPWVYAFPSIDDAGNPVEFDSQKHTLTAYVVGWPGTLKAGQTVKINLYDWFYEKTYTWTHTVDETITFKATYYYTFDLTDENMVETDGPTHPDDPNL